MNLSIIIPVYNPPHNLFEDNIKSLTKECEDFELIYLNDGSTDKWIDDRLQKLKNEDSRVTYIKKQNSGVSDTRNKGIEIATGKYIMFVDADDYITEGSINYILSSINKYNADVIIYGINQGIHEKEIRKSLNDIEKEDLKLATLAFRTHKYYDIGINIDGPCNKLFKREIIIKNNIRFHTDICKSEDAIFDLYLYECAKSIVIDNKVIYNYIYNENSISHNYKYEYAQMIPIYLDAEREFIKKYDPNDNKYWDALATRAITGIMDADHLYFSKKQQGKSIFKLAQEFKKIINTDVIQQCLKNLRYNRLSQIQLPGTSNKLKLFLYKHNLLLIDLILHKIA